MLTIRKYEVPHDAIGITTKIEMPIDAEVLSARSRGHKIRIWAVVDDLEEETSERTFSLCVPGTPVPRVPRIHVGTVEVLEGDLTVHVFELV